MTTRPRELRRRWLLDPGVRFLNHGSFGACPRAVLEAQAAWRARMEREPVRFLGRELAVLIDGAIEEVAAFLGADPRDVVPVANATTGVNAVLGSLDLGAGDELLLTSHGYNACRNAAELVAARAGARVVVADVPFPLRSEDEVVAAVLDAVTPRTRLALLDHVTSPTGLVLPLARLVPALRERGAFVLIDGAHAPGMLDLDVPAVGADAYTGNLHKWVCAPKGAAFLWVRREHQAWVRPPVISHGANTERPGKTRFQVEFGWLGTDDPTPFLAAPDALRFLEDLLPGGLPELRRRNRELALAARRVLLEALDVEAPAPEALVGSLASVPLPPGPADAPAGAFDVPALQRRLYEAHRIEVPVAPFPAPPQRLVRVSAQAYVELEDVRALAAALLEELAAERAAS